MKHDAPGTETALELAKKVLRTEAAAILGLVDRLRKESGLPRS